MNEDVAYAHNTESGCKEWEIDSVLVIFLDSGLELNGWGLTNPGLGSTLGISAWGLFWDPGTLSLYQS